MTARRIVIMGAAGRDFHDFNVAFRDDSATEVVAFTAAQIPGIADRRYPASLAGSRYPDGIPIVAESRLPDLCRTERVDQVVFAYSDLDHAAVMHKASTVLAAGADFTILGPTRTMLPARVPVISVCAVRTGVGKSQVSRFLARHLRDLGLRIAVIRHPMPYGDLERQAVQRFASLADLDAAACTIEEREEYEPHIAAGGIVHAGVDYARILARAESEADLIIWDGGNNDFPFIRPNLAIALVDALRPGQTATHHPGETVLRMADVVIIAKANAADPASVQRVADDVRRLKPTVPVVRGASVVRLDRPDLVRNRRVVVVDDGPTLTHGGMEYGAGFVAAIDAHAAHIVDPRPTAVGSIAAAFREFPHLRQVVPALGYSATQIVDLAATLNATDADVIVAGTPTDLTRLAHFDKPVVRARYEYADAGDPDLMTLVMAFVQSRGLVAG